MTPDEARDYLYALVQSVMGRSTLALSGHQHLVRAPLSGTDDESVKAAEAAARLMNRFRHTIYRD